LEGRHREWAVDPGDCQQFQGAEFSVAKEMTEDEPRSRALVWWGCASVNHDLNTSGAFQTMLNGKFVFPTVKKGVAH